MQQHALVAVRRTDYRPPAFRVEHVALRFELDPHRTLVSSRLRLQRNPAHGDPAAPLHLDGEGLTLVSLALDGEPVDGQRMSLDAHGLSIADMPDAATLDIVTRIDPAANTELSGLYLSGGAFFTQCEAEGFRRITFFPDRPDVMARFEVTVVADAALPVLLSNGNPAGGGRTEDGRHWARWDDPHPKPSYLFALVAGDLVAVRDRFVTRSGRPVELAVWVRDGDQDACGHAMHSLKQAMQWDEQTFDLEYDLDVFNIAAVSDFNMGAMENKGLNVFNTKYVLARPDTATDIDYQGIETVIAHEYFHNWTGNRITCRDWFQLSLKEGLTVFRDQQFTMDQGSAAVKRLADVRGLRAAQFTEDAGPMAHPVRPDSYVAIDNFYTATVYQKGAEVVRMLHTMLGPDGFRRGMAAYVARNDNQAVTIEDFVSALSEGGGTDLSPFLAWYAQAGTPVLTVSDHYDAQARRYVLTLSQQTAPTPGQPEKRPLPLPVRMGLLADDGRELETRTLLLTEARQDFAFERIDARPVPSLLRGFSAPVRLEGLSPDALRFLAAHDTDPFVRWDSLQQYAAGVLLRLIETWQPGMAIAADDGLAEALQATLAHADDDAAFAAETLSLPSASYIASLMTVETWDAIHAVRQGMRMALGQRLAAPLAATRSRLHDDGPYRIDGGSIGRRALRNACLGYLAAADADGLALAAAQFDAQANMTDVLAALSLLCEGDAPARAPALAAFYARWRHDPLVLDKWFALQAASPRPQALDDVRALAAHPDFTLRNPNRARALIAGFSAGNPVRFHDESGSGYAFLKEMLAALDAINGQTAARLVTPFASWRRQTPERAALMRAALERLQALPGLSRGTAERVALALA